MSDPSTEAALREMSRTIGGLESTVKSLVQTWQTQEASASQGRRDMHQKFDAVRLEWAGLAASVANAVKEIDEIKPSVRAFENAKQQAKGAQFIGKFIWAGLPIGGGVLGWMIAHWISLGPKPPLP